MGSFRPGERCVDASGVEVPVPERAMRIVSLVPSVTETLFALGLGERVVGVTDWCIHPADLLTGVARVRGTKNPDCPKVAALAPDLVLANLEENREVDVRRLRERGLAVWVDYPRTVDDALAQVDALARLGAPAGSVDAILEPLEQALRDAAARHATAARSVRGFIAVWKDPWMTLSHDTYAHDLLARAGIANVFADAPGRYPRLTLEEVAARDPEVVLLPDEPYRFTEDDARELTSGALAGTSAARHGRIRVIDGTLPFWPGPRTARAMQALRALAHS
ncbi:MAG: helical backbone metal receptor [Thermodesulfobacteriota bacterium]